MWLFFCLSDYDALHEDEVAANNQLAFDVAERHLGIQPVTTGKEMVAGAEPDKLLMVLYLSKFYVAFRNSPGNKKGQSIKMQLFLDFFSVNTKYLLRFPLQMKFIL